MDESMKQIVAALKPFFDKIEARFDKIESDLNGLKGSLHRTMVKVSNLEPDVADMKRNMATKDDLATLKSSIDERMDRFARSLDDARFRWAVHADTLVKHDKRLARLESRRA